MYDNSCVGFGEKFDMEHAVKKMDMEIHNLEMETSESHGTFKIPKLKKVNKFKVVADEEKFSADKMNEGERPTPSDTKTSQCPHTSQCLLPASQTGCIKSRIVRSHNMKNFKCL